MKNYLLPRDGQFYKANLHCHSTISDGKWTVEQIKQNYKEHGYSVVAFTDHQVFICHNELTDKDFLALNGYEIDISENKPWGPDTKTCHFCLIALDQATELQEIYCNSVHIDKNMHIARLSPDSEPFERKYDAPFISDIMKKARDEGFFVTYNHPVWSQESRDKYLQYHGMNAVEIVNYSCCTLGHDERNENLYDSMLHHGEQIYCVATDDNHDVYPIGHPKSDSFGGFTMIKADKLEYGTVTQALLDGHFYASEAPQIYELYYDSEDQSIHISTSEAVMIVMATGLRLNTSHVVTPDADGQTVTGAAFKLDKVPADGYVRFTVRDANGKEAYTNAYRISDILRGATA